LSSLWKLTFERDIVQADKSAPTDIPHIVLIAITKNEKYL